MVRVLLWLLAVALLVLAVFAPGPVTLSLATVALAVACLSCLYRPPDNHIGVVYRFGRLHRLLGPEEWTWIIPLLDRVRTPIGHLPHQMTVKISDLLTGDRIPIVLELLGFYQLDPRLADAGFRLQFLYIPETRWEEIIGNILREVAGEVVGSFPFRNLLTSTGRNQLKQALSAELARRVQGLGIGVDRHEGVTVLALRPMDLSWFRLQPLLEGIRERGTEEDETWRALVLEWAAAVGQNGSTPQTLITPGGNQAGPRPRRETGMAGRRPGEPVPEAGREVDTSRVILLGSRGG
ncbi:MAG: SPFH domain-containing protein [Chloroflexia bacterium]